MRVTYADLTGDDRVAIGHRTVRRLGRRAPLGKLLQRGDKITVVTTGFGGEIVGTARARVIHAHRGRVSARSIGHATSITGTLYRRHEGRTWARGWDTPEAATLEAEIALMVSR